MIDSNVTHFQNRLIKEANKFVYRNTPQWSGRTGTLALNTTENRLVMAGSIALASAIDYPKLFFSAIESFVKSLALLPFAPFRQELGERSFAHLIDSIDYTVHFFKKFTNIPEDLSAIKLALQAPYRFPTFAPAPHLGSTINYARPSNQHQIRHPSLYS